MPGQTAQSTEKIPETLTGNEALRALAADLRIFAQPDRRAAPAEELALAAPVPEAPLGILVPMWLLVGATVFFGIFTGASAGVAEQAAVQLLGGWAP